MPPIDSVIAMAAAGTTAFPNSPNRLATNTTDGSGNARTNKVRLRI